MDLNKADTYNVGNWMVEEGELVLGFERHAGFEQEEEQGH